MEKNTTTFDTLQNHCNYPTVCLLLDTAHRTNNCINVCGKWIFDYNLESALPLTEASLNYICSGNDPDEIIFVGVLHASSCPKNIKYIITVINWHQYQIYHYHHCSNLLLPHIHHC